MNKNKYVIRLEEKKDYWAVENLTREAFWNVYRPGCFEHYVLHCYRAREDFVKDLDFVMEIDNEIMGHVMYARAKIQLDNGKAISIMTFGPISILPKYQRQGYGKILLDYSLEKAKELGTGAVCMEGNIDFYGKSGFVVASTKGIHYYAEPRENVVPYFLVKELQEGFLNGIEGTYKTPDGYFVQEADVQKFDLSFPPKEKKIVPGQLW